MKFIKSRKEPNLVKGAGKTAEVRDRARARRPKASANKVNSGSRTAGKLKKKYKRFMSKHREKGNSENE